MSWIVQPENDVFLLTLESEPATFVRGRQPSDLAFSGLLQWRFGGEAYCTGSVRTISLTCKLTPHGGRNNGNKRRHTAYLQDSTR